MPARGALWLVSYDIADPRRLARVARAMTRYGVRVQYSVFAVLAKTEEIRELKTLLATLIKPSEDDVRIYPISPSGRSMMLGASMLAPDMLPQHPAFQQLRLPLTMTHNVREASACARSLIRQKLYAGKEQTLIWADEW